jgi:hypothetical protein
MLMTVPLVAVAWVWPPRQAIVMTTPAELHPLTACGPR